MTMTFKELTMLVRRSGHVQGRQYEHLLDTGGRPTEEPLSPLASLLAAATAPGHPGELAGEEAAVVAFRAARAGAVAAASPTRRRRWLPAGVGTWLGGLAIVATAGVAVAATGLDSPSSPGPGPVPGVSTPSSGHHSDPTMDQTTNLGRPVPTDLPSTDESGSPEAGGRGQCLAYLNADQAQRRGYERGAAYRRLVDAAGGADRLADYCQQIIDGPAGNRPTDRPGRPTPEHPTPSRAAGGDRTDS